MYIGCEGFIKLLDEYTFELSDCEEFSWLEIETACAASKFGNDGGMS